MINNQPNININIMCSLPSQKTIKKSKVKKNSRMNKGTQQSIIPYDIEIKMNNKNLQNNNKKSNQSKFIPQAKKLKKKIKSSLKNNFISEYQHQKKVKYQKLEDDQDVIPTIKKQMKSKWQYKSNQLPLNKTTQSFRKINLSKTLKSSKKEQTLLVLNQRRYKTEQNEGVGCEIDSKCLKKKKSSSLFKGKYNKIVNKLLDTSQIAYQIRNSLSIASQKDSKSSHYKNLDQYMSSIDIKIFQNLQIDLPIFSKNTITNHQNIIKTIMKYKSISLQDLTRKIITIQRAWRKINKNKIIHQYKMIFALATHKLVENSKQTFIDKQSDLFDLQAVSKDMLSFSSKDDHFYFDINSIKDYSSIQIPTNIAFQYPKEQLVPQSLFNPFGNYLFIKNQQKCCSMDDQVLNLPLNTASLKSKQIQQWNNINKKISSLMNGTIINSNAILQDLIKQSNLNKQWIQDTISQEEQFNDNTRGISLQQLNVSDNEYHLDHDSKGNQKFYNKEIEEDSMQHTDEYDFNKYKTSQQIDHELQNNGIIKDYLDCGLSNFDLKKYQNLKFNIKDHQHILHQIEDKNSCHLQIQRVIAQKMQDVNNVSEKQKFEMFNDIKDRKIKIEEQNEQILEIAEQKLNKTIIYIIQFLINEFAHDIGYILKKVTQNEINLTHQNRAKKLNQNKVKKDPFANGIKTNLQSIEQYINKLIQYVFKDPQTLQKIHRNINKNVGPSSLEILSYLRPDNNGEINSKQDQQIEDEAGLFVIPAQFFDFLQKILEEQYFANKSSINQRIRAYLNFWNRCIFQSYNEFLDFQRPFGIQGQPYIWLNNVKRLKVINKEDLKARLMSGQKRLLSSSQLVGGILFQKGQSPFTSIQISQQQKFHINQEREQRILANELLQSESLWKNFNDELAEISTELSYLLEDRIFFEVTSQLKKIQRMRRVIVD